MLLCSATTTTTARMSAAQPENSTPVHRPMPLRDSLRASRPASTRSYPWSESLLVLTPLPQDSIRGFDPVRLEHWTSLEVQVEARLKVDCPMDPEVPFAREMTRCQSSLEYFWGFARQFSQEVCCLCRRETNQPPKQSNIDVIQSMLRDANTKGVQDFRANFSICHCAMRSGREAISR